MRSYLFLRILFVILSVFALTIPSISDDNRGREYLFTISDSLHNNIKNLQTKSKNSILKRSLTISDDSDVRQVFSDRAESLSQWYLLRVSDTQDPRVEALQKNSNVIQMQENHTFRVHIDQPNDPLLSEQWYHERLNTAESWGNFTLNPDIILAVIDTGVDYVHPDLTGSIWINHAEDLNQNGRLDSADINLIDDDGNGYVDDVIGWDFTDAPRFADGGDYMDPDNDPMDEFPGGHGTKIAGLIAAGTNNALGIAALLPGSRVMNIRAGTAGGYLEEDDVAQAVLYAINNGANIINMSFGDVVLSNFLKDVIEYTYSRGVIVVASAGNSGTDQIHYPSGLAQTISVGATDINDQLAGFSNWGQSIDLVAPGVDLVMPRLGGGYEQGSGTSFSAPLVAAVAVMLLSKNPEYSVEQIRNILKSSSDDIGVPGWDEYFGSGRLNMLTASQINKESSLFIHYPSSESTLALDSIPVIVTAQDPDLLSLNLSYALGDNPEEWFNIVNEHHYQVIEDTLIFFSLTEIPDTTLTLRLQSRTWSNEIIEYRSFLEIDRTAPLILKNSHVTVLEGNQYAILIEFETDDITTANLYYRTKGTQKPFEIVNLNYQSQDHNYLLRTIGDIEYYFQVTNRSGLETSDTNDGEYYSVKISTVDFNQEDFLPVEWTLPAGYLLDQATDFDQDGFFEIVISRYDNFGSFGPIEIYEFNGNGFTKEVETDFKAIPRDFGDTDDDNKSELLLGYGQNSYILESDQPAGWPSEIVWTDTSDFWISRICDLDKDGIKEISGKEGSEFVLFESNGDNTYNKIAEFPNTSPGDNQLGPPRITVADLDNDGLSELFYGDYDGDIIIYENSGNNTFEPRGYVTLPLQDATDHFVSGKVLFESTELLIAGSHKGANSDYEHDFGVRYWTYSAIRGSANNTYSNVQEISINGFSSLKDFDSGINTGNVVPESNEYLFLTPHPDLYLFKSEGDTMVPVWYLEGVNTNTVLSHDFDKDGVNEFYFNTGEKIVGYKKNIRNKPRAPMSIQATPLDTSSIIIEWDGDLDVDRYILYRGFDKDNLTLYDSVTVVWNYVDSNLVNGKYYYYALQTVDNTYEKPRSDLSAIVSAVPNSRPSVDSLLVKNEQQIEIYFNEPMDPASIQSRNFYCDPEVNTVTSAVPFINGKAVLISFSIPFIKTSPIQLELIALRDTNRTTLIEDDWFLYFTYIAGGADKPYVQEWRFEGSQNLLLRFNTAMNVESVLNIENYKIEPSGRIVDVEIIEASTNEYRLKLSNDTYRPSSGITTYLVLENIKSNSGTIMSDGNRIALVSAPDDIDNIVVYPQPVTPSNEWLMFSNIAPGTSVKIFDINGHLIYALDEEDNNGGIRWDLKDRSGNKISAGIYIYYATFNDQKKIGKFAIIK